MKLKRQLTSGSWVDCGEDTSDFIARAAKHTNLTVDRVVQILDNADKISYGTDWNENLVDAEAFERYQAGKKTQQPIEMVKCSYGHTVPKHLVMSASLGTACDRCYDQMSD